ncbi:expressed unknown protein [Seminavis robusta]|uniref:Uncharacterized protein n=1 Tax=Seminavis robusta TaxID=568900 RepID=A0A9N8EKY7_9STRA|nr:expressed unknown protein [Seminavis robusta]|eukprot:Sro1383_g267980.1 n/a (199) ;mRNA; r:10733-11477
MLWEDQRERPDATPTCGCSWPTATYMGLYCGYCGFPKVEAAAATVGGDVIPNDLYLQTPHELVAPSEKMMIDDAAVATGKRGAHDAGFESASSPIPLKRAKQNDDYADKFTNNSGDFIQQRPMRTTTMNKDLVFNRLVHIVQPYCFRAEAWSMPAVLDAIWYQGLHQQGAQQRECFCCLGPNCEERCEGASLFHPHSD